MKDEKKEGEMVGYRKFMKRAIELFSSFSIFPSQPILTAMERLLEGPEALGSKIQEASESLLETKQLLQELEWTLEERAGKLRRIQEQYERYSKLASTEKEKSDAFLRELKATVRKERLVSLAITIVGGIVVFFIGVFLSPLVKALFHLG